MSGKMDFMKGLFRRSMLLLLLLLLSVFFVLFGSIWHNKKTAKGDRIYGGEFSYSMPESIESLFPLETNKLSDLRIISQLFDPLVKQQDSKGGVRNYLAENITSTNNGSRILIRIKKGVRFHNDDCFIGETNELTADDVAFTLSFACSKNPLNQSASLLKGKIVGSDKYYENAEDPGKNYVPGVRVLGKHLVEIQLAQPFNHFIQLLTHPSLGIMSKNSWKYYGSKLKTHPVGSGPFYIKSSSKSSLLLERNNDYWKTDQYGNQLPYIDGIRVYKNTLLSNEYPLFSSKKIDVLFDLPVNDLEKAFGTLADAKKGKNLLHKVHIQKASKMHYIAWNMNKPPFNSLLVRRAFTFALDKDFICTEILKGDGRPLKKGFIPTTSYYSNEQLPTIEQDVAQAKNYLLQAGYSANQPFPTLFLYLNAQRGSNADLWCSETCRQLKRVLGVDVKIKYVSTAERDEKIKSGEAILWKAGWVGDYPDAESYLRLFNDHSRVNTYGIDFQNSLFEQLFARSLTARNPTEKTRIQQECEAIVMKESAIFPVYSEDFFVMINLRVRGFEMNTSGIIDFSKIYLKDLNL